MNLDINIEGQEMDTVIPVQSLDAAFYILRSARTLRKGMNPNILPRATGK